MSAGTSKEVKLAAKLAEAKAAEKAAVAVWKEAAKAAKPLIAAMDKARKAADKAGMKVADAQNKLDASKPAPEDSGTPAQP